MIGSCFHANTTWRQIPGFDDYQVNDFGMVRRTKTIYKTNAKAGAVLKPRKQKTGYYSYSLRRCGQTIQYSAHRLVALVFIGPLPFDKADVAHWDGNKLNNHVSNLRYCTRKENVADTERHGKTAREFALPQTKLSDDDVRDIRLKQARGINTQSGLAREYNVSPSHVSYIISGKPNHKGYIARGMVQ